jgi:hypothetical protein
MNKKYMYSIKWKQPYTMTKPEIICTLLNDLHSTQLDMIDEAVEKSDLRQAKEVIDYIKNKG